MTWARHWRLGLDFCSAPRCTTSRCLPPPFAPYSRWTQLPGPCTRWMRHWSPAWGCWNWPQKMAVGRGTRSWTMEVVTDRRTLHYMKMVCLDRRSQQGKHTKGQYCSAVFGHFLDPPGNHPRGAIFPTVDQINQSINQSIIRSRFFRLIDWLTIS